MTNSKLTKLQCPKCLKGVLTLQLDLYIERFVPIEVLLCNLNRLDKPILKYGAATENTIGIGYTFQCSTSDCSLERFFDDEEEIDEYVRDLFGVEIKSEETFIETDQKFVALIRREVVEHNERT